MSATHDLEMIAALSPIAIAGYLRANGWTSKPYGSFGAIFEKELDQGKHGELLLSTVRRAADFTRVNSILVNELADYEGRSTLDLFQDLSIATYDVIKVRSHDADELGSIPVDAGVEIHEQARDLILSIANAAAAPEPRANWRGRRFDKANSYLNALRLGQSQKGSFILTLLSPWDFIPSDQADQVQLLHEPPFGRRVTNLLAQALNTTRGALDRAAIEGIEASFAAVPSGGVSSNFCTSLARLAQSGDGVDISIRWSSTASKPEGPSISIRRDEAQSLLEASRLLVHKAPIADFSVEGLVYEIRSSLNDWQGEAILLAKIDDAVRRVRVRFRTEDRAKVYEAGQEKAFVEVTGDLKAVGRTLELSNPRGFRVLTVENDSDNDAS